MRAVSVNLVLKRHVAWSVTVITQTSWRVSNGTFRLRQWRSDRLPKGFIWSDQSRFLSRFLDLIVLRRYDAPINASNISGACHGSGPEESKLQVVLGCDGKNVLP